MVSKPLVGNIIIGCYCSKKGLHEMSRREKLGAGGGEKSFLLAMILVLLHSLRRPCRLYPDTASNFFFQPFSVLQRSPKMSAVARRV